MSSPEDPKFLQNARAFRTTHWSVVLAAQDAGFDRKMTALEELCRTYWYPIYAYVRGRGHNAEDSQDLTQGFFARFLEKDYLASVDAARGKFRSFLLASMNHYLCNEWDRAHAKKRGGDQAVISLDQQDAEGRYLLEPAHEESPEKIFDRNWAEATVATVLERLREECNSDGRTDRFEVLKTFLVDDKGTISFAEAARLLGISEAAAKSFVRRLRLRFRELFREELSRTVTSEEELAEEIRHVAASLRR